MQAHPSARLSLFAVCLIATAAAPWLGACGGGKDDGEGPGLAGYGGGSGTTAGGGGGSGGEGAAGGGASGGMGGNGGAEPIPTNSGSYAIADFAYSELRDDSFQPLTRSAYRAIRSDELAVFVSNALTGNAGFAIDDLVDNHGDIATLTSAPSGRIFDVTRGDVNDDGKDEAILVRIDAGEARLSLTEYDDDGALTEASFYTVPGPNKSYAKVATGDMDGDLRDEIVVATLDNTGSLRVEVLDDRLGDSSSLGVVEFAGTRTFAIATGDFDSDGIAELVVLKQPLNGTVSAHFYTLEGGALTPAGELADAGLGTPPGGALNDPDYTIQRVQVVTGDIDGDGRDEVIFGVIRELDGLMEMRLFAHDDRTESWAPLAQLHHGIDGVNFQLNHRIGWHLATADTNGDQRAEVVSLLPAGARNAQSDHGYALDHFSFFNDALGDQRFTQAVSRLWVMENSNVGLETGAWLTVLGDRREDRDTVAVSVLDASGGSVERMLVIRRYSGAYGGSAWSLSRFGGDNIPIATLPSEVDQWINPVILGLDLDGDSLKLEYTGEKWLSLPEPLVILAMAAPPVHLGISQNYSSSATAYGHEVSSGTSRSEEVGTSVGATVSFESPSIGGIFTLQASASIERALATTHTSTRIETYGTSFAGSALHNYVIFQGTLYTSYKYKVVAAADPEAIGTYVTIDEPISTKLYKWTVDYFNDTISNADLQLGSQLFVHTPGDVSSYGDATRRNGLLAGGEGWQSSSPTTVGQGQGSNRTSISLGDEVVDATALTITKSVTAGGSVAGVGFEGSFALSEGNEWSVSVGNQTSYEGEVGDIATAADYMSHSYSFGIFVYNYRDEAQTRGFQVIDYWVEALGPGYVQTAE